MRAAAGEEQPTPLQFWLHRPPTINDDKRFLTDFICNQKKRYGNGNMGNSFETDDNSSILQQKQIEKDRWLRYITVPLPEKKQWQIMVVLHKKRGPLKLTDITKQVKAETRDDVVSILKKMMRNGIIDMDDSTRNINYSLSAKSVEDYFTFDHAKIGTAEDIPRVTQKVVDSYLDMDVFVTIASQYVEQGKYRPDLIGYHFDKEKSISIEIESASELTSHPEHARFNMEKWRDMGFDMCHCWSESKKLLEVYDSQVADKDNVRAFVIS